MITKRKYKRYHSNFPLKITTRRNEYIVMPGDICVVSCYFNFPQPFKEKIDQLEIIISPSETIKVTNPKAFIHSPKIEKEEIQHTKGGFGLRWELSPEYMSKLQTLLEEGESAELRNKRTDYIVEEQKLICTQLEQLERTKHKRQNFLFSMIVGYLAYLVAPFKLFPQMSAEIGFAYAIGGIWVSVCMIYYTDRLLKFLGIMYKYKAIYHKAANLNRSYLFKNDAHYYSSTIFPLGIEYDDSRAWTYTNSKSDIKERFPAEMRYNSMTTFYFMFIELLFVVGVVIFSSMILRAITNDQFYLEKPMYVLKGTKLIIEEIKRLNLIDLWFVENAFVWISGLIFLWIEVCLNECKHYQIRIWESKKVKVLRPNPKFRGIAFKEKYKGLTRALRIGWRVILFYGSICTLKLLQFIETPLQGLATDVFRSGLFEWWIVAILAVLLFSGKFFFVYLQIKEETRIDDSSMNLEMLPYFLTNPESIIDPDFCFYEVLEKKHSHIKI